MRIFCDCARDHVGITDHDPPYVLICECGRVLEKQTLSEYKTKRNAQRATFERLANLLAQDNHVIRLYE